MSANGTLSIANTGGGYVPPSNRPYSAPAKGALSMLMPLSANSAEESAGIAADGLMHGDSFGGVALTSASLGNSHSAPPSQSRCSSAVSVSSPDSEQDAQHQKEKQVYLRYNDGILPL
jgi:hypothetical protein